MTATPEMRAALSFMRMGGTKFHHTTEKRLPCGCAVLGGWRTDTFEPYVGSLPCGPDHRAAALRAQDRQRDALAVMHEHESYSDSDAVQRLARLLAEEIG